MEPLLGDMPLIGALSVFFLKKPVGTLPSSGVFWFFFSGNSQVSLTIAASYYQHGTWKSEAVF